MGQLALQWLIQIQEIIVSQQIKTCSASSLGVNVEERQQLC